MSHFNKLNPYLIVGNTETQIPEPDQGGREEDFLKESEIFTDLNRVKSEEIQGFRLFFRRKYGHLSESDLDVFIWAYNENEGLRVRFAGWPKSYRVIVTEFKKGLRDGLKYEDSLEITFQGVDLIPKYPDKDLLYTIWSNDKGPALCIESKDLLSGFAFNSGEYDTTTGVSIIDGTSFSASVSENGLETNMQPLDVGSIYRIVWEGTSGVSLYTHDGLNPATLIGTGEGNFDFTADEENLYIQSNSIQTVTCTALKLIKIGKV